MFSNISSIHYIFLIIKATKKEPFAGCLPAESSSVSDYGFYRSVFPPTAGNRYFDLSTAGAFALKQAEGIGVGRDRHIWNELFDHKLGLCINFHNSTPHTSIKFINNRLYLHLRLCTPQARLHSLRHQDQCIHILPCRIPMNTWSTYKRWSLYF